MASCEWVCILLVILTHADSKQERERILLGMQIDKDDKVRQADMTNLK